MWANALAPPPLNTNATFCEKPLVDSANTRKNRNRRLIVFMKYAIQIIRIERNYIMLTKVNKNVKNGVLAFKHGKDCSQPSRAGKLMLEKQTAF
jgi:hypothetical protein